MISDFSQKIIVVKRTLNPDWGFGGDEYTDEVVFSTWASIKEISRREAVAQQLSVEDLQYKMRIRYVANRVIDKDWFIDWNAKRHVPLTSPRIIEIDKRKFLETIITLQNG